MADSLDIKALYVEHRAYVLRVIRQRLSREFQNDAEDVAQNVWLLAWRFHEECAVDPKTWLTSIAINGARDHVRKRCADSRDWRATVSIDEQDENGKRIRTIADPSASSAHRVIEHEWRAAVDKLPKPMARAMRLKLGGYGIEESAKIAHCSKIAIRVNITRGRAMLRKRMHL